ncbi:hypothetical protein Rahaq_3946 [Rahnella aceris]|uniref:Uncharacterized protein n=2 Tax=Rahnella sp. (strain Y9602) TaxID=2703885 RepID=A0A0H3FE13_RAHSY|nr:hypothetical protein Rahaq_3946 [Rahnella aceris]AYA08817.1 hypothetical protein D3Z09_20630 [Rahnella aquatilis]AZP53406.1 hypothetical protein EJP80_20420 [Rahnella aquatilis]
MKKIILLFIFLNIVSVNSFSATIPKGGVFKFAESDSGGGTAQPLDMPLALPIANFFGYTRSGDKYSYEEKNSLPIAINIMYIESSSGQVPAQRLPEITDDNFDFSEHYLHYDTQANYSWVSGGKEGDWGLPIINAKPYQKGDPFPAITACSGTPVSLKEQRYKCKPAMTSSTRNLSLYDELIELAASKNQKLWVGTIIFPRASDGPEGNTSNNSTGGEGHELVVYLPHRHMEVIHLEALLLGDADGSEQRLAAWTLQSDDGEYFVRYKSFRINNDYPADYAFVSNGKDTLNHNKTESKYLIPYYLDNERMAITDVAAIHTRLAGGVHWSGIWNGQGAINEQGIRGSDIFTCLNGAKGSVDDYTDLTHFQDPAVDSFREVPSFNIIHVPEGQKGFTFAQMMGKQPTSDNAYICDTKGTQLFSQRLEIATKEEPNMFIDFMEVKKGITEK